ncbi:hypothetical protein [Nonomuraea typhae]|uniref:hypothetical protein n=1 Tax=Nonomuraea typhae TaxID=2603600 RepID=UPI0012FCABF2|nr:hypothetical protein [Nonomuraea typhae]
MLVIDMKYHWSAFMLALFTPVLLLNGHAVPVRWGRNEIPLAPGQYHLRIHVPYLFPFGVVEGPLRMAPGRLDLEYRAPLAVFFSGALGPAPQKWNGMVVQLVLLGILVAMLLFVLLIVVFAVVAAS